MLNEDQKEAFDTIRKFLHSAADTFVLKGYAGTGKTFLMQHLAKWLKKNEHPFSLLASTGRAATVLRGKTGFATKTVHSELYNFNKVLGDSEEIQVDAPIDQYGQMTLQFILRGPDQEKRLYIVDEASMLSSEMGDEQSLVAFGSGILLTDFFDAIGSNKIIFVGDPCQLPPVDQKFSPALEMEWLEQSGRTAITFTLNKIERTDADNDILTLANSVRNYTLLSTWPTYPKIPAKRLNNVSIHQTDECLFQEYLRRYRDVSIQGTVAIARSNVKVAHINREVRRDLYGQANMPLQVGETLLVVQNNYAVPLTNGDFVVVTSIGESRNHVNLLFTSIRLKALASEEEFGILLSMDILLGEDSHFSSEQQRALMVDFSKRMRRKGIKPNSEAYKKSMMEDPFINCLKAKFGYAVTCHKAQGGEWDHVYLFLDSKMYGMQKPELFRWWYTAVTRAKQHLNLADGWWIR